MICPWETVRPKFWHPLASLEQSMMDFEDVADQMLSIRSPFEPSSARNRQDEDDEFFKDLHTNEDCEEEITPDGPTGNQEQAPSNREKKHSYSNYSYSSSSVFDHQGRRISSTRRRFEDSKGRLKALHEREIDGKKMRSIWDRKNGKGKHDVICSEGSPNEFEKAWAATPFGKAQLKSIKQHEESNEKGNQLENSRE